MFGRCAPPRGKKNAHTHKETWVIDSQKKKWNRPKSGSVFDFWCCSWTIKPTFISEFLYCICFVESLTIVDIQIFVDQILTLIQNLNLNEMELMKEALWSSMWVSENEHSLEQYKDIHPILVPSGKLLLHNYGKPTIVVIFDGHFP